MKKIRSGLVGVAIIGSLVGTIPITAFAEPVPTADTGSYDLIRVDSRTAPEAEPGIYIALFRPQARRGLTVPAAASCRCHLTRFAARVYDPGITLT